MTIVSLRGTHGSGKSTNKHTEQSERAELINHLTHGGCILEDHADDMVLIDRASLLEAAALLAADKAGGEEDDAVAYLRAETTLPKYRGWAVCEDDDPNGFPVYRHPQPQPSALPDDVAKDAAMLNWMLEHVVTGSIGFGDWWISADDPASEWKYTLRAAMLKEGKV